MPSPIPPFDRAIALACTMATLRGRWLQVRRVCGHLSPLPSRLLLAEGRTTPARTLADTLVRLRCDPCGGRPTSVHLIETGPPFGVRGDVLPGWQMVLHGMDAGFPG